VLLPVTEEAAPERLILLLPEYPEDSVELSSELCGRRKIIIGSISTRQYAECVLYTGRKILRKEDIAQISITKAVKHRYGAILGVTYERYLPLITRYKLSAAKAEKHTNSRKA